MSNGPLWITNSGLLFTTTEKVYTSTSIVATGTNISYRLISGNLPPNMSLLSTGTISGTPDYVLQKTNYNFVIRATDQSGISDRSFYIDVEGSQIPQWNTSTGYTSLLDYNTSTAYLKLGPNGENFTLDKQYVYYQFSATATNAPSSTQIKYYIPENGGQLPPGILLNQDGVLSGFMNDNLVFDGTVDDLGGYDEEEYDEFTYDFGAQDQDSIGVPKIYQFKVTASDGVYSSDRFFKILVVNPQMIRTPEQIQMTLESGLITTNSNYLPPPQFIKGTNLGIARAENNETFDISAYDAYPLLGNVDYSLVAGQTILEQLPKFLKIDTVSGNIYGYIPYQPAYSQNYTLTVNATKSLGTSTTTATNTFTLTIQGDIDSSIEWVTSSTLGSIYTGYTSELFVEAKQVNSEYSIKYFQISGTIPDGLTLQRDGTLSGSASYNTTGTYTFVIRAQDVHELSSIDREFSLSVQQYNTTTYTKIWIKPFLPLTKRAIYRDFMSDEFTFPQSSMYRFYDSNFGVQTELKMILEFGIQKQNLTDYLPALRENFYRKRFYLGEPKIAVAKTNTGSVIYEVVYLDVVDPMKKFDQNLELKSVDRAIYTNNNIYYPNSIDNMRYQLEHLTLNNNDLISVDEFALPRFMRTAQSTNYKIAGYMHVVPLCYVLPGEGQKIISRIKLSNFNFAQFDIDIDRMIIADTLDSATAKYLLFPRNTITDQLDSDNIIYVFDESPLETNDNNPISRE